MGRDLLLSVEGLVAAVIALLLLFLLGTYLRRRAIARGRPLVLCAIRDPQETRWKFGLARYGSSGLDWFRLGGVSVRPAYHWSRGRLDLEVPRRLEGADRLSILPEAIAVPCRHGDSNFELALAPASYTALRSWLESSPPGLGVNVA
ncbi:MAG TPA: DUF2550 domain-containing protein [Segeticoccus sp.]|uniref:DUF2550 domain-containing protein n=1 Tax=Segeticoccus sp. TaxID=2706531 RepID=UPI002D7E7CAA|nr:DUF2550 domain-containing protein [Segeticoccus sp.]HET8601029.1 DUF2550 domain-containing protein [Segeticoccus sp.]